MPESMLIFNEKLKEAETIKDIEEARKTTVLVNVNQAVDMFTSTMKRVSECMKRNVNISRRDPRRTWIDKECQEEKNQVKRILRIFRRSKLIGDRSKYAELRKQYRKLL